MLETLETKNGLTSGGLSLEKMKHLLLDGAEKINSVSEKEMILVLGNTGAGKSTTINYQLGIRMKKLNLAGEEVAEPEDKAQELAEIGHDIEESKTLYPQIHESDKSKFHYCDCAGFLENRGREEEVLVSVGIRLAVYLAKKITAALVVIDYNTITTDRGAGLIKLGRLISKIFKDPLKLSESVMFVITNKNGANREDIVSKINGIIRVRQKKSKGLLESLTSLNFSSDQSEKTKKKLEKDKEVLKVLNLISANNYERMVVINVFDNFESKAEIENILENLKPIGRDEFKLGDHDNDVIIFREVLSWITWNNSFLLRKPAYLNNQIKSNIDSIRRLEETKKSFKKQLDLLEKKDFKDVDDIKKEQQSWKEVIEKNNMLIDKLKGSKIYILPDLPQLFSEYRNSYIFTNSINVNGKKKIDCCYVDNNEKKHILMVSQDYYNVIIGEINGTKNLMHTLSDTQINNLRSLLPRKTGFFKFIFGEYNHAHSHIYFMQKLPPQSALLNHLNSWIFVKDWIAKDSSRAELYNVFLPTFGLQAKLEQHNLNSDEFHEIVDDYGYISNLKSLNETLSIEQFSAFLNRVIKNSHHIGEPDDNLIFCERRIKHLEDRLKKLDSSEPVFHWIEDINETSTTVDWLFSHTKQKSFKYEGIKICDYKEKCDNGSFKKRKINFDKTLYDSTYESEPGKPGIASVEIYIEKRDVPENAMMIKSLQEEIEREKKKLDNLNAQIWELNEQNKSCEKALTFYDLEHRVEEKANVLTELDKIESEIKKLRNNGLSLDKELIQIKASCKENQKPFMVNLWCIDALNLSDPYYKDFRSLYLKYQTSQKVDSLYDESNLSLIAIYDQLCQSTESDLEFYQSKIDILLSNGADLNETDEQGRTLLHLVVENRLNFLIPYLISKTFSLELRNKKTETPILTAVRCGNIEALKLLQEYLTGSAAVMLDGTGLLHYALINEQKIIFEWLINRVPKSIANKYGQTVLHEALSHHDEEAVKKLLKNSGPCDLYRTRTTDKQYYSVLHEFIEKQDKQAVELIITYADPELLKTALDSTYNAQKAKELYFSTDSNLEESSKNCLEFITEKPLACALRNHNIKIIKIMLNMDSVVFNNLDSIGNNVFHIAAQFGDTDMLDLLQKKFLEKYGEINLVSYLNQRNLDGFMPLHLAVEADNHKTLTWFIFHDKVKKDILTKPAGKDIPRQPILHLALLKGHENALNILLEATNLNFWQENSQGITAWVYAKQQGMNDMSKKIQQKILNVFFDIIRFRLDSYFQEPANSKLTDNERLFVVTNICSAIRLYIESKGVSNKKVKKIILSHNLLDSMQLNNLCRKICNKISSKLELKPYRDILFNSIKNSDYKELQEILSPLFLVLEHSKLDNNTMAEIPKNIFYVPTDSLDALKEKGFKQALGEALRYLYYVNLALVEKQVDPKETSFHTANSMFSTVTPTIAGLASSGEGIGSIKINLAFTLVNIFFSLINAYEKKQAIESAQRIVEAFQGGYRMVDVDCIEGITETFYLRFKDQINQMSISISTNKKLRLHEKDGVVQFAYVIASRIGAHILKGRNNVIGESDIAICRGMQVVGKSLKINFQKIFGKLENIKKDQPMPILQRCILATFGEIEEGIVDRKIELDKQNQQGQTEFWLAGYILTRTGYRLIDDPNKCYIRKDYFEKNIGFCYVTMDEIEKRGGYVSVPAPLGDDGELLLKSSQLSVASTSTRSKLSSASFFTQTQSQRTKMGSVMNINEEESAELVQPYSELCHS